MTLTPLVSGNGSFDADGDFGPLNQTAKKTSPQDKIFWGSWSDYQKVAVGGEEYAQVGGRLYSRHAVNRMQPRKRSHSSKGNTGNYPEVHIGGSTDYGRSVSPNNVEEVISYGSKTLQDNGRVMHRSGTVEVITETDGTVVTIITN